MRSEERAFRTQLEILLDSLAIAAAFFATYYLRKPFDIEPFQPLAPVEDYLWILILSYPIWWVSLIFTRIYSSRKIPLWSAFIRFVRVGLVVLIVLTLIFFAFQIGGVNRTLVVPFLILSVLFLFGWRLFFVGIFSHLTTQRKVLIVGEGEPLQKLLQSKTFCDHLGDVSIGCVFPEGEPVATGWNAVGRPEDLPDILHNQTVDELVFAVPFSRLKHYEEYLRISETMGVNASILVDIYQPAIYNIDVARRVGFPFLVFSCVADDPLGMALKDVLDRCLALFLLILLSPMLILVSLLIKFTSRGPVLLIQDRVGLNGRIFRMYKFRTMRQDAAQQRASLQNFNEMDGPVFKIRNDPRVTRIGRFLRKYSVDELPQLLNVLKGEMSLVGPRPLPSYEATQVRFADRRRLCMKPGITCIWQTSGRNAVSYEEWMRLDLDYIQNWSLWLDFKILLKTVWVVCTAKGAS